MGGPRTRLGVVVPVLLAMAALGAGGHPAAAGAASERSGGPPTAVAPVVTLAFLPAGTDPRSLAAIEGVSPGLLSAGLGAVPAAQTYLDISQGNRVFESLYDGPLPSLFTLDGAVPAASWHAVVERARSAPADIEPGLLAGELARAGAEVRATPEATLSALVAVDRRGRIPGRAGCAAPACTALVVTAETPSGVEALVRRLGGDDLVIALERPPPPEAGRHLAIGIAGRGFDGGTLTSDSTRLDGLVLSTDLAPTILDRLGAPVPGAVSGSRIRSVGGRADGSRLVSLEDRIAVIGPRRGPVIGSSLLIWVAVAGLAIALLGSRGARVALPLLALTGIYLPAVLLLGAVLEPSETVERLIVGLGCPMLAAATLALDRGYAAVAIACAVSVFAYGIDVLAGSPLTPLSLIGSNPALGVRFFGIGNELEATVATLIPIGVGAWLAAGSPGAPTPRTSRTGRHRAPSARFAAIAFGLAALVGVIVFAPGPFGADVGAAIVLPVGGAVAAWFVLGGTRRLLVAVLAVPVVAVGALLAVELVLGGEAHLSRSVLEAGGLDEVAQVVERRLRLSAESFARNAAKPSMLACIALIVTGVILRRRIAAWFAGRRAALAGLLGAIAATLVGTLANDSGALLLMIGTGFSAMFVAFAWANHRAAEAGTNPLEPDVRARPHNDHRQAR